MFKIPFDILLIRTLKRLDLQNSYQSVYILRMVDMTKECPSPLRPLRRLPARSFAVALAAFSLSVLLIAQQQGPAPSRAQLLGTQGAQGADAAAISQSAQQVGSPSVLSLMTQVQVQGPYRSSIPDGLHSADLRFLSFDRALELALRSNLGPLTAAMAANQAHGGEISARSALLPNISAVLSENVEKVDLASEGFNASSLPSIGQYFPSTVGPFHFYTAQAQVSQSAFDLVALRNYASAKELAHASRWSSLDAREQLTVAVAGTYLQVMAATSLVESQLAQVKFAKSVYEQALVREQTGAVAQIEVNRSLVEYQTAQQRLLAEQAEVTKLKMVLSRVIGLPIDAEFELQKKLPEQLACAFSLDDAYERSNNRRDLASERAMVRAAELSRKAAAAEDLPSVGISGSYGLQGVDPNKGSGVYNASASLVIPLFSGRRTKGDQIQAEAALELRRAELASAIEQARFDVRTAWIDLDVALKQVGLAGANRDLARNTLAQSMDRFAAGAADSVEVVQSQESVAAADHDYIGSVFSAALARVSLARAMGEAEKEVPGILKGSKE